MHGRHDIVRACRAILLLCAMHVQPWCYSSQVEMDEEYPAPSATGSFGMCLMDGECANHQELGVPRHLKRHDDSALAYRLWDVGQNAAACLARARQWHVYCGNSRALRITATFVPTEDQWTFPELYHGAHTGSVEWVMLLHVTDGYMDFFENFLAHYKKIGNWSQKHVLKVVLSSEAAARYVSSAYGDMVEIAVAEGSPVGRQPLGYNDKGFTNVVSQRPSLIRNELLADRNVLYIDVDVVLLADPFASLPKGYDIWTSMDHSHVHCTGILAMQASHHVIDLLDEWEKTIAQTKKSETVIGNQEAFNLAIRAHGGQLDLVVFKLSEQLFPPGSTFFAANFAQV
jgi:hypothetical protein